MKKLSFISLFIVLAITILTVVAYASTSGKMELSADKSEYNKDNEVVVEVKIAELESDTGIIGLGGVIEYNKDVLDFVKIEGIGDWSKPTFNEVNGKWITDRGDLTKNTESVFKITFKVKADADQSTEIKVSSVETSGGEGAYNLDDASKSITIKKKSNGNSNNNNNNNNNGGSQSNGGGSSITATTTNTAISLDKNVNKTATGSIPKAGLPAPIIMILIVGATGAAFVFYIKFEKICRRKK